MWSFVKGTCRVWKKNNRKEPYPMIRCLLRRLWPRVFVPPHMYPLHEFVLRNKVLLIVRRPNGVVRTGHKFDQLRVVLNPCLMTSKCARV